MTDMLFVAASIAGLIGVGLFGYAIGWDRGYQHCRKIDELWEREQRRKR